MQEHEENQMGFVFFASLRWCVTLFAVFVVCGDVAAAHHGTQAFDITKTLTLRGTIVNVEYVNPHVVLTLDVRKDGSPVERWQIALAPPSAMVRKGVARDAIKEGAVMSVTGYAATTVMAIRFTAIEFTLPDGRTFVTGNASFRPLDPNGGLQELTIHKK
jgi:Family of unknown function (DUF6152)